MKNSHGLLDKDMQTNETNETAINTKNKEPREFKPPPICTCIYGITNFREVVKTPSYNDRRRTV
jgi:hypothetical protein